MPNPRPTGAITAPRLPASPRVLLIVDFINPLNFPGAEDLAGPALEAARATAALKERLAGEGVATIYANDNYGVWQSDFHSLVTQCLGREDESGRIAKLLSPRPTDITLLKPRHSAFFGSPLELLLDGMGCEELILCGLAADMCVLMTAADAFLRNYRVVVPSDCTAAESPKAKADALKYMATILKCDVMASKEIR